VSRIDILPANAIDMTHTPSFAQQLIASIHEISQPKTLSKGEFLLREGDVERNFYWIETGAVRVFYLSEYEEQVVRFGYAGSLITSLSSFITAQPSEFYIAALRKTKLHVVSKPQLMERVHANQESLQQYVVLLENLLTQQIDREMDLLITSPSERLRRVLQRSPLLFQEIPLKYIANYLRMKPETLSRIRNS
jgi:CRP/FNR family transcriptional regulator, anaerobic regulatory protein